MVNLIGHEAGNGGNSQGTPTTRRAFLYSDRGFRALRDSPSCPSAGISLKVKVVTTLICQQDGMSDLSLRKHKSGEKSCHKPV